MGGWRSRSRNVVCWWISGGSENPRDGVVCFREGGFLFGQVLIPGLGVPDLCPGSCANDGEFPAKTCILPERRRNRHAPLLVRYLVRGSREENTDVVTCLLGGNWSLPHLLVNPAEFRLTEDVDATLLAPCENQPAGKFLSELRGEDNSTFFIQTRRMCAEKHGPPPVCFRKSNVPCAATTLLRPPHYSTSLHSQRHARDVWTILRMFIPLLPSICRESGLMGESGAIFACLPPDPHRLMVRTGAGANNSARLTLLRRHRSQIPARLQQRCRKLPR